MRPRLDEIARLENARAASPLIGSLGSGERDPRVRARALRATARLQDPASVEPLISALGDEDAGVRHEAAFALELLGLSWEPLPEAVRARAEEGLLARLAVARGEDRSWLLKALSSSLAEGSDPNERGARALIEALGDADAHAAEVSARGLGNFIYRYKKKGFDFALVEGGLGDVLPVRRARAYLLMRAAMPASAERLAGGLSDPDPEVRALSARGLGALKDRAHLRSLGRSAITDGDWRVRVQATRSLALLSSVDDGPASPAHLFKLAVVAATMWGDRELYEQPELASAVVELSTEHEFIGTVPGEGAIFQQVLPAALDSSAPTPLIGEAAALILPGLARARRVAEDAHAARAHDLIRMECAAAMAVDRAAGTLDEVKRCGGETYTAAMHEHLAARTLAEPTFAMREIELLKLMHSADAGTRTLAVEALGKTPKDRLSDEAKRFVREALADKDGPLVATAAEAEAAILDEQSVAPLIAALARYAAPDRIADAEITQSLARTLGALHARPAEATLRTLLQSAAPSLRLAGRKALAEIGVGLADLGATPPTGAQGAAGGAVQKIDPPAETRLRLHTEKGEIVIALFRDEAPGTVRTIVDLAKRGFYSGLDFHRVVPDFVSQGGDPRGDGWGGPGFTIRCEPSPLRYERGTVGMALSGKDTGGSQFFITHSAQPHLEGRYTIFGQVITGMDAVDRLLPGDKILKATVEK